MYCKWLGQLEREGKALGRNFDPKAMIERWGNSLLSGAHETSAAVDAYAVYEQLMNYWAETMQDDCYLISRDGWKVNLIKPKKRNCTWRDFECDLLPPMVLIKDRFPDEYKGIVDLAAKLGSMQAQYDEMMSELEEDDEVPDEALKLKKSIALFKKDLKEDDLSFTSQVEDAYEHLGGESIKELVVFHKWCESLSARFAAEQDRVRQQTAAEVQSLAARYADTLPDLEARVKTLRGKVAAHLKEMGVE